MNTSSSQEKCGHIFLLPPYIHSERKREQAFKHTTRVALRPCERNLSERVEEAGRAPAPAYGR